MNIYKIVCRKTGLVYVGSTKKTIKERLIGHYESYQRWKRGTYACLTSFKVMEANDYYIELIEVCDEAERYMREGFYIQTIKCVNNRIPALTRKEYRQMNKERRYEYNKIYNKEHNHTIECECGSTVSKHHISRHHRTKKHIEWTQQVDPIGCL